MGFSARRDPYNLKRRWRQMCEHGNQVRTKSPQHLIDACAAPEYVFLDRCCVDAIDALWSEGIVTYGVCCGHGKTKAEVFVSRQEADRARRLLPYRFDVVYHEVVRLK